MARKPSKYSCLLPEIESCYRELGRKPEAIAKVLINRYPEELGGESFTYLKTFIYRHLLKLSPVDSPGSEKEIKWDEKETTAEWNYSGDKIISNLEEALSFSKVDLTRWQVDRHVINFWTTTYKDKSGVAKQKENVQVKVWFKRVEEVYTREDALSDLRAILDEVKKPRTKKVYKLSKGERFAQEIDVFDAHLGKLAWHRETGENYDIEIAKKRYIDSVGDLLQKGSAYKRSEIIYPLGNDFFQVDNDQNATTKGTRVDADVRWQKSWTYGRATAIETILMCAEVAPVKVMIVPGNHDFTRMFYLGDLLEQYFSDHKNITVDNSPSERKYWAFGKCATMFTHGAWGNPNDYHSTMLAEMLNMGWTKAKFLEVHHGHFHKSKRQEKILWSDEIKGVNIRCLRSISGTDAWHYLMKYINNVKGAESFIYSSEAGLVGNFYSNILNA